MLRQRRQLLGPRSPLTEAAKEELAHWLNMSEVVPGALSEQTLHVLLLRDQSRAVRLLEQGTGLTRNDLLRYSVPLYEQWKTAASYSKLAGLYEADLQQLSGLPADSVHLGALLGVSLFVLPFSTTTRSAAWDPAVSVVESLEKHAGFSAAALADTLRLGENALTEREPRKPLLAITVDDRGNLVVAPFLPAGDHPFQEEEGRDPTRMGLLLPAFGVFSDSEISDFQTLLSSNRTSEADFQRFFAEHPKFLYLLGDFDAVQREVELPYPDRIIIPPTIHTELSFAPQDWEMPDTPGKVDFMLRRSQLDRWDPLELKLPEARLVVGTGRRGTFSQQVHKAISQLRDYVRRLEDRRVREYLRDRYNMRVSTPRPFLLIGRDHGDPALIDRIDGLNSEVARDIGLYTYDNILRMAKRRRLVYKS